MLKWAFIPIIALVVTSCDFSHVDPKATVVITGRALSATGAPLRNVAVSLYKEPDVGEAIVGTALALGSLGGVCLFPGAPAICRQGRTVTTNAAGAYRFTIKGSDTQGLIGDASTLDVVFSDPKKTASTTLRFKAQSKRVTLPAARLWQAGLHVKGGTRAQPTFTTSWSALPGAAGSAAAYSVELLEPDRGLTLWTQAAAQKHTAKIDARILEDRAADAAVVARADLGRGVNGVYFGARRPVRPVAGAAPSRHAGCSAVSGTTKPVAFKQTVCVATDGDFASPARLTASSGKVVSGVVIDLGRPRRVSLIVGRGLGGSVVVEVSTNGKTYRQVSSVSGSGLAVDPPGRPVARYVRVRSPGGLDESLLTEVSVW